MANVCLPSSKCCLRPALCLQLLYDHDRAMYYAPEDGNARPQQLQTADMLHALLRSQSALLHAAAVRP
jgi:hypothetical protein